MIRNPNMKRFFGKSKGVKDKVALGFRRFSSEKRVLPDFLIIGGKRCGTTVLFNHLSKHPNVHPPYLKEIHFFDRFFHKGLAWYRSHFPPLVEKEEFQKKGFTYVSGEGSPSYLYYGHVPQRIKQALPDVRLIILLRNPVDRAYSHYQDSVKRGLEALTFENAIEVEATRLSTPSDQKVSGSNELEHNKYHFSYMDRGLYANQLKAWTEHFPLKAMHIIRSEDMFQDTHAIFMKVTRFLGLPDWEPTGFRASQREEDDNMAPETRQRLVEFFRPYNEELEKMLNRPFGWE